MSEIYIDIEKWLRRPPVILPGCSPIVAMKAMVSHWDLIDRIEKIKKNREGLTVNYEYLKGSKKDFEGSNDGVMRIYRSDSGSFLYADIDTFDARWELIAERRPISEPVWSGEGLPPVGAKCEVQTSSNSPWFECEIVYSGESGAAFISTKGNSIGCVDDSCTDFFRPIRSSEDVARDDFIKKLSGNVIEGFSIGTKFAAALYDAGYRKME